MASLNGIVANLKRIDVKKNSLQKAILGLAVEWRDLDKNLDSTRSCFDACVNDLELKQKDLECKQESVAESSRELNEVWKKLDLRLQEVEHREENMRCCYQAQIEKLELKEKQLSQIQARIEEKMAECEKREEKIFLQTKSMEVLSQNIEKEKAEFDDTRKSTGEKFKEICSKEKNYENLCKEVNLIQCRMETWAKELGSKEEQLKELQKLKEERGNLDINVRNCELKEEMLRMEKKSLEDKLEKFELEKEEFKGRKRSVDEMLDEITIKESNCKNMLREVNLIQDWTERQGRELYSIKEEFASKEEQLNARKKMNDKLSEELDVIKQEYKSKEKKLEMEREEFQNIQISVDKKWEEILLKEKNTEDQCEEVKLIQDQIERQARELDLREEQLQEMEKMNKVCREDLDAFEKECKLKEERLCVEKKSMDEQSVKIENEKKVFEGSKKSVTDKLNEISLKERNLEDRSKELKSIQDWIERRARELDLGEAQLSMETEKIVKEKKDIEDSKTIIVEKLNDISLKKKNYEDLSEKAKLMVDQIESRAREFDSKEEQVALREEKLKSKLNKERREEVDITLSECELKKEKLYMESSSMELDIAGLEWREKQLDSAQKHINQCFSDFHLKSKQYDADQKLFEERCKELESKEKLLEERLKDFEFRVKHFEDRFRDSEFKEKQLEEKPKEKLCLEKQFDNVKTNQVEELPIMSLPAEFQDIVTMGGESLQLYMCEHYKKHSSMPKDVCEILKSSSDPAKLVLEAMEWFYPPHLKKEDVEFKTGVIRMSCILLLEKLMMLSPHIGSCVRKAALSLAGEWKVKMEVHKDYMEVLGFVQLLACYKLASYFDADELLQYLELFAMRTLATDLCWALDLSEKIPDLISSLITNNKHWVAIKFIVEFGLVEKFPPVPLLQDYFRVSKKLIEDRRVKDKNTVEALGEAFDERIAYMRNIVNCIQSHKLESGNWNLDLEKSILQLTKQKIKKCTGPTSVVKKTVQKNDVNNFFVPLTTAHTPLRLSKKNCFSYILANMDGNNLLLFLNKHMDDHGHLREEVSFALRLSSDSAGIVLDAIQVFYSSYLIKGGSNIEASVVRTCNLLLEELMKIQPAISPQLKEAARDLAVEWRSITVKLTFTGLTLGFLLFMGAYRLTSVFDSAELLKLYQTVGKHKLAPKLCHVLGFSEEIPVSNNLDQSGPEDLELSNRVTAASGSNSHGSWNAIPDAIRHALDPAQLVLDALEACYYSPKHSNISKSELMQSSHFLLRRLLAVPLEVKRHTKDQAKKFAADWTEKIERCNSSEVSCLLLLLTIYKVLSSFPMAEVLGLLEIVYDDGATNTLFQSLRLSDEVPRFIRGLVERGGHLGAIKYVYAFGLVKKISPFPILEDYIKSAKEEARKIRQRGEDSQEMANKLELSAFKAVMDCVRLHGLESVYPFKNLKAQIEQMETQVPDLKETNMKRKHGKGFPNDEIPLKLHDSKRRRRAARKKPNGPDTTFQSGPLAAQPAQFLLPSTGAYCLQSMATPIGPNYNPSLIPRYWPSLIHPPQFYR